MSTTTLPRRASTALPRSGSNTLKVPVPTSSRRATAPSKTQADDPFTQIKRYSTGGAAGSNGSAAGKGRSAARRGSSTAGLADSLRSVLQTSSSLSSSPASPPPAPSSNDALRFYVESGGTDVSPRRAPSVSAASASTAKRRLTLDVGLAEDRSTYQARNYAEVAVHMSPTSKQGDLNWMCSLRSASPSPSQSRAGSRRNSRSPSPAHSRAPSMQGSPLSRDAPPSPRRATLHVPDSPPSPRTQSAERIDLLYTASRRDSRQRLDAQPTAPHAQHRRTASAGSASSSAGGAASSSASSGSASASAIADDDVLDAASTSGVRSIRQIQAEMRRLNELHRDTASSAGSTRSARAPTTQPSPSPRRWNSSTSPKSQSRPHALPTNSLPPGFENPPLTPTTIVLAGAELGATAATVSSVLAQQHRRQRADDSSVFSFGETDAAEVSHAQARHTRSFASVTPAPVTPLTHAPLRAERLRESLDALPNAKTEWILLQQKLREMDDASDALARSKGLHIADRNARLDAERAELDLLTRTARHVSSSSPRTSRPRKIAFSDHSDVDDEEEEEEEDGSDADGEARVRGHSTDDADDARERVRLQRELRALRAQRDAAREKLMYAMVARLDRIESRLQRAAADKTAGADPARFRCYDSWRGDAPRSGVASPRSATTNGGIGVRASIYDVPPWRTPSWRRDARRDAARAAAAADAGGATLDDRLRSALMNLARVQRDNEFL